MPAAAISGAALDAGGYWTATIVTGAVCMILFTSQNDPKKGF
jgi:hypothetical protein